MKKINADEFKTLVQESKGDVYVDFYAEWCGPCRSFAPILGVVAKDETVYSVDVDEESALAIEFEVSSIPCLILFRDGKEYERSIGVIPEKKIRAMKN
jgi:thioredoxin 1